MTLSTKNISDHSTSTLASVNAYDDMDDDLLSPNLPLVSTDVKKGFSCQIGASMSNFGKVMYVSCSFLSLIIAVVGVMTMVSEIYDQLGYTSLGKINLVVIYVAYCSMACFVPSLIANWRYKTALFVGSTGFLFTMVAGVLTAACAGYPGSFWCSDRRYIYAINIACSFINGLTEPILWLAGNAYITACTDETNKGKYLGIFSSFISAACVTASALTALCTRYLGQFPFFIGALSFTCLASIMFAMAPDVPKYTKEKTNDTVLLQLKRIARLMTHKRMMPLLPNMVLVGILLAVYNAFEYEVIINIIPGASVEEQNYTTSIILTVQGAITIVASYVIGVLADKMNLCYLGSLSNVFTLAAIAASYLSVYWLSLPTAYLMACLWGIGYTANRTLNPIMLAKDFNGSMESFAIAQFVCNFATAVGSMLCIYLTDIPTFLFVMLGFLLACQLGLCLYKGKVKTEDSAKEKLIEDEDEFENDLVL